MVSVNTVFRLAPEILLLQLTPSRITETMKRLQETKINLQGSASFTLTTFPQKYFAQPQFVGFIYPKNIYKKVENIFI